MVQDLTANRDFQGERSFGIFGRIIDGMNERDDDISSPYDEIVLTGTAFDRDHKRYILDYESEQKNMCDCCGSPIKNRPWDFEEEKTLCPACEKWLEETQSRQRRDNGELLKEVVDDTWTVRVVKPWDINDFDRENAVDNVLLWD